MRNSVHSLRRRSGWQDWGLYAPTGQRKYLTDAERRRFMAAADAAPAEVRTLCLTLAHVGCRISEALALKADDIDLEAGLVVIRTLKQRGRLVVRLVPAPPALLAVLREVHQLDVEPGRKLWRWHRTRAWELVKGVMAAARVYHLPASPKGLRHAFGVHAVLSGMPLTLVQKWLGHSDLSVTAIYTNVLGREEREIAQRMW